MRPPRTLVALVNGAPNLARNIETGAILGVLVVILAWTGLLLSPTVSAALGFPPPGAGGGNFLYAIHLAAASLLVVFTVWHLVPIVHAFTRKTGRTLLSLSTSHLLLLLVMVEIVTGYVLWFHDYRFLPKATAVQTHLLVTFVIPLPLVPHAVRGARVWLGRRRGLRRSLDAASRAGTAQRVLERQAAMSRRAFLRLTGYAAAGIALAYAFGRSVSGQLSAWRLNYVGETPIIPKEEYRLLVTGLVDKPLELTYDDIVSLGPVRKRFTHHCVEGWTYTDTFTGVPLNRVLDMAGVRDGAAQVVLKSAEVSNTPATAGQRYTTNFPVDDAFHDDVLLVFGVGDEDLPALHGGPMRIMSPVKWGYKACKWLNEVEVTSDAGYRGYWERLGYHNDGDYPGPIFQ